MELQNNFPTGNYFQQYINPDRDMPDEALKIHGLTKDFLADKPFFSKISKKFLDFLGKSELVIHNAKFDLGFLNHELDLCHDKNLKNFSVVDLSLIHI